MTLYTTSYDADTVSNELEETIPFIYFAPHGVSQFMKEGKPIPISFNNYWVLGWSTVNGYYARNHSELHPSLKFFNSLTSLLQYDQWFIENTEYTRFVSKKTAKSGCSSLDIPDDLKAYLLKLQKEFQDKVMDVKKYRLLLDLLARMRDLNDMDRDEYTPYVQSVRSELSHLSLNEITQYFHELRTAYPGKTYAECHLLLSDTSVLK